MIQILLVAISTIVITTAYLFTLSVIRLVAENSKNYIEKGKQNYFIKKFQRVAAQYFGKNTGLQKLFRARLTTSKFSGLPMKLMVLAALYAFAIASEFLEELLQADKLIIIDQAINSILEPARGWPLIDIFAWITMFGNTQTVIAVCVVISAFLRICSNPFNIIPLWITILGSIVTTWTGKYILGRERPEPIDGLLALSPSFPSGHATIATAVYGFFAYLIVRDAKQLRLRFEIVFWTIVFISLIGFSRIFLRFHYTSDVVTGFLVGGFWLLVGFIIAEYRRMELSGSD